MDRALDRRSNVKSADRDHPLRGTVGARTAAAGAVGLLAGVLAALIVTWQAALLVGWDFAAAINLIWTWLIVGNMGAGEVRAHATAEDPSRQFSEAIIVTSGVALLAAVGLLLIRAGQAHGTTKAYLIGIGVASVMLSWATVHTIYTLRYARTYSARPAGGIDFNEKDGPTYLDFAYLSFTIGMTFQVSDTDLTTKAIRRIALGHALISYLFGAIIVALSINVVASLLG
jgi:uncharacterized membrane protein